MSHSFLDFPDFDGAWRYSSAATPENAEAKHIHWVGQPAIIHIRTPAPTTSHSFNLDRPTHGSIARRRTRSDATSARLDVAAVAGAERPISEILVCFKPVAWPSGSMPHPGTPAAVSTQDNEAVSPKSRLPSVLQRTLRRGTDELSVRIREPIKPSHRVGTSVMAVKSPYPRECVKCNDKRAWFKGIFRKIMRR